MRRLWALLGLACPSISSAIDTSFPMREVWFADKRDLIKWGVLVHLAHKYDLKTIVQVPYLRPPKKLVLISVRGSTPQAFPQLRLPRQPLRH
jgi:hypothetical protein